MRLSIFAAALTAGLLSGGAAQALEITQYDRLAAGDQSRFVDGLVKGAIDILNKSGHSDQAAKVRQIFAPSSKAFPAALAHEREVDNKRYIEMPDATRLEVEDAMIDFLKKDGIALPDSFYMVNRDFRARLPVKPY